MEINGALDIFQRNFNRSVVLLDCREGLRTLLRYGDVCLLWLGTGTNLGTKVNGRIFFGCYRMLLLYSLVFPLSNVIVSHGIEDGAQLVI